MNRLHKHKLPRKIIFGVIYIFSVPKLCGMRFEIFHRVAYGLDLLSILIRNLTTNSSSKIRSIQLVHESASNSRKNNSVTLDSSTPRISTMIS
jgi:hypothetical protein